MSDRPSSDDLSRRAFLDAVGGTVVAAWLASDRRALGAVVAQAKANQAAARFEFLSPAEGATLDAFAARIIPTDDTPGAREAGAVWFIDKMLSSPAGKSQRSAFRSLAKALDADAARRRRTATFASLTPHEQDDVIGAVEKAEPTLFDTGRAGVIFGTFADPRYGGNRGKVGWRIAGFDDPGRWTVPYGWYDRDAHHP